MVRLAGAGFGVLFVAACVGAEMPVPEDGRMLFQENCAVCHGADGTGGGPAAADLAAPPPDLTGIARREGGFPRAAVMSTIDGYTRTDSDRAGMPEFGLLLESELVPFDSGDGRLTPTPRALVAILTYLESIQRP